MARYPCLPLWTDAWVADTQHLTRLERGTYLDLLVLMWRSPNCEVPDDPKWLARKLKLSDDEFANDLKPLIKEFCQRNAGLLSQKRLKREWGRIQQSSARQSKRAKSRWDKEKDSSRGNAALHASGNASISISTKESIISESILPSLFDWPKDHAEVFWSRYPLKVGRKKALEALEKVRKVHIPWPRLLEGLDRYAASVAGKEPKYIKHATTWLNGAHWDDVIPQTNGYHPKLPPPDPSVAGFFIKIDTPQWRSWQEHLLKTTGKGSPCVNFGWRFPTEWPPEITNQEGC